MNNFRAASAQTTGRDTLGTVFIKKIREKKFDLRANGNIKQSSFSIQFLRHITFVVKTELLNAFDQGLIPTPPQDFNLDYRQQPSLLRYRVPR